MTLGQNIQNARKAKGMSQETLAEKNRRQPAGAGQVGEGHRPARAGQFAGAGGGAGTGVDALLGAQAESPEAPP